MVGDRYVGQGSGASKKEAEFNAAADALQKEFGINVSIEQ
jgi:dsRNA-specific ribonuclease